MSEFGQWLDNVKDDNASTEYHKKIKLSSMGKVVLSGKVLSI